MVYRNRLTAYFQELEQGMSKSKSVKTVAKPKKKASEDRVSYAAIVAENLNFEFANHPTIKNSNALVAYIKENLKPDRNVRAETFDAWCNGFGHNPTEPFLRWVAAAFGYDRWESLKEESHKNRREREYDYAKLKQRVAQLEAERAAAINDELVQKAISIAAKPEKRSKLSNALDLIDD